MPQDNNPPEYAAANVHPPATPPQTPRTPRPKAFKGGIISYQNHTLTADCIIRDINERGVKLKFEKDALVPEQFALTIPMEGIKVDCKVKWRRGLLVGAEFISDMEADPRNARRQSVDAKYIVPRKSTVRKA